MWQTVVGYHDNVYTGTPIKKMQILRISWNMYIGKWANMIIWNTLF